MKTIKSNALIILVIMYAIIIIFGYSQAKKTSNQSLLKKSNLSLSTTQVNNCEK